MKIITHPNPILRQKSINVEIIDESVHKLVQDMIKILLSQNGLGLAAPQVGKNIKIFIVNKKLGEKLKQDEKPDFYIFVNPRINWKSSDKSSDWEGCLSLPGLEGKVERPNRVRIKAQNLAGQKFSMKADMLLARAIQHEFDHLEGILYIDYIKNKKDLKKIKIEK